MSRTYSPMKWPCLATHHGNREKTNPANLVMRRAKTRAGVSVQKINLARARRKRFKNEMLVP
jgi:hypothetical protein